MEPKYCYRRKEPVPALYRRRFNPSGQLSVSIPDKLARSLFGPF
jgi:hypothetical protein